jgi:hypothetical protein
VNKIGEAICLLTMMSGNLFHKEEVSGLVMCFGGDNLSMKTSRSMFQF